VRQSWFWSPCYRSRGTDPRSACFLGRQLSGTITFVIAEKIIAKSPSHLIDGWGLLLKSKISVYSNLIVNGLEPEWRSNAWFVIANVA